MSRWMREVSLLAPMRVWLLGMLAGCGGGADAPPHPTTLTILQWGDELVLSPVWDMSPKFLLSEPLVAYNEHGEMEGRLAHSWEHVPGSDTWTVYLRSDVSWHDGVPVTADDIRFSEELRTRSALDAKPYLVTVLDDTTYTITFSQQSGHDPIDWWTVYWPKHLLEDLGADQLGSWQFWNEPVGNGPYRYVRHVPQTMIELAANPDYYRGKPLIDRIVLKLTNSSDGSLSELLSGNVDIAQVDPVTAHRLDEDPRFETYHTIVAGATTAIAWNQTYPPLSDARVRRALTLAIDRRELHRVLDFPPDLPIYDVLMSTDQHRRGEIPEASPHDLELARELLRQAGWHDSNSNGVVDRDGHEFHIVLNVRNALGRTAGVFVQAQLRSVGISVEVRSVASAGLLLEGGAGGAIVRVFHELGEGRWHLGRFIAAGSPIGYRNPEAAHLVEKWRRTLESDDMDGIYQELQPLIEADPPMTYLYPEMWMYTAHKRVRGLSSPSRADPYLHIMDLWIEDEP